MPPSEGECSDFKQVPGQAESSLSKNCATDLIANTFQIIT